MLLSCIVALIATLTSCVSQPSSRASQASKVVAPQKHETFLDIPIVGSMASFGSELEKIGFKDANDGIEQKADAMYGHLYVGRYAGHDCFALVCGTLRSKEVFGVVVSFTDEFNDKNFNELKSKFNKKYGTPKQGKSVLNPQNVVTVYSTDNGIIELTPKSVVFCDKLNLKKFDKERVDNKI